MVEPINISKLNYSVFNISNYQSIINFTNLSNPVNFFLPVKDVWMSVMGNWFFTFIIFVTCGVVYIKSRSIFPTSLILLLMSATMIAVMPHEVGIVMYLALVLAIFGVLYGLLAEERW